MKDVEFNWTYASHIVFAELNKRLSTAPILHGPNWDLPFHIFSDSSDTTVGVVLGQQEDHNPYAIYYISKNMSPAKLNYIVTEKEFLVFIYSINKFRHYITGYPNFVHTDHSTIRY